MTEVRVIRAWSKLVSSINTVRYTCKKKERKKKKKDDFVISTSAGFSYITIYKQLIPVLCKREDGGKQERRNKTTFIDFHIRANKKKGLRHRRFCSFQCFKIWPGCLNFKHWPILSSTSDALLIFTVKSTLNYTRVLRSSTKKKKKKKKGKQ